MKAGPDSSDPQIESNLKDDELAAETLTPLRFIVDGPPGSGKTTCVYGNSHEDPIVEAEKSIRDYGIKVFPDSIHQALLSLHRDGIIPFDDPTEAVRRVVAHEVAHFAEGNGQLLVFHDKGLPGYEYFARRINAELPDNYEQLCSEHRYQTPVFIFAPIPEIDLSKPREGVNSPRKYTFAERLAYFDWMKERYESLGYETLTIPVLSQEPRLNVARRIDMVLETAFSQLENSGKKFVLPGDFNDEQSSEHA